MMYMKFPLYTKYIFFNPAGTQGEMFSFSSNLDKIGEEWDIRLANGTFVDIISDPVETNTSKYGSMSVIKIKADVATDYHTIIKEFWVPTHFVVKVD